MNVSRREMILAGAVAVPTAGFWAKARGQDQPVAPTGGVPAGLAEDPLLAAGLLIVGRKQIANSQLALQRAQNPDVRAFAEAEVAEHRTLRDRLMGRGFQYPTVTPLPATVAGGYPVDAVPGVPGNPPPEPTANRPIVLPPGTRPANNAVPPPAQPVVTPPPAAGPNAATPLVSIGRVTLSAGESRQVLIETQVGDECVATFLRNVGVLSGPTFDKAYVGNQMFEHYALLDRAAVYRRHASPALLPVFDEALPVIQRHVAMLRGLMARLDGAR